jgi:glycosyltransferase involved in cell wall biosynthesis
VIKLLELRNTYKWGGGPDKTILLSAERHDPKRVSVVVVYIRGEADREFRIGEMAQARGLTFYEIAERGKLDLRVVRAIREIVRRHQINIIHAHDYKSDLFAYLVGRSLGRRRPALVSTAHAWVILGRRGDLYRRLDQFLMRRFDQLIAVSHATKAEMVSGVPGEKIAVVHNAIETTEWSRNRANGRLDVEWGIPRAAPIFGYVGRIMPEKDLETWLRAAALISSSGLPNARFVLVGDGADGRTERALKDMAADLGIGARTIFTGFREDLLAVYATFDVFMMTSQREGLPNSILEAMAMGLPVVTTDVAGAKELVVDGLTGFVRPQRDATGLAAVATTLGIDAELRIKMGAAGRERIEHEFSFTGRLARIEDLYEQVVARVHGRSMPVQR